MNRTKYAVVFAAGVALGLLSAKIAVCADGQADRPAKGNDAWDEGAPLAGGSIWEVAQVDVGPGGPPPRRDRGPDGFQLPGQGRAPDGPPPGDEGPGRGAGMPGGRGGPGPMPGGMGLGMGMGPDSRRSRGPDLEAMKERDPEMYKLLKEDMDLEHQTRELAMQYQRAPSLSTKATTATDDRAKIKQQIEEVVGKHFDARQQRRSLELKRLESELQRLREAIDRRAKARKELVEKRVSDLIGREEEVRF